MNLIIKWPNGYTVHFKFDETGEMDGEEIIAVLKILDSRKYGGNLKNGTCRKKI